MKDNLIRDRVSELGYKKEKVKMRTYFSVDYTQYNHPTLPISLIVADDGYMLNYKGINKHHVKYIGELDTFINDLKLTP